MSEVFDSIMRGLNEIHEDLITGGGKLPRKTYRYSESGTAEAIPYEDEMAHTVRSA